MPRHFPSLLLVIAMLLPCTGYTRSIRRITVTLSGTLTIKAKEGTALPGIFVVVLYRTDKSVFGRQAVVNNGEYRFEGVGNGDWEIAVEADGADLVRLPLTLMEDHKTQISRNLELEYRAKSEQKPVSPGTISARDFYQRGSAGAAQMKLATAAGGNGNHGEAARLLQSMVEADPKDFEAWTDLGNELFHLGKALEAERAFQQALRNHPSYPLALLNLGKLNYSRNDYKSAITNLTQLVEAHPESCEGHRFLGEAYLRIKKGSKAVPELQEAARLDPDGQAEAHLSLAALFDAAGLKGRAAIEYEQFLLRKPGFAERKKLEKYIREYRKF